MRVIVGLLPSFATKKLDILGKQIRIQGFSEAPQVNGSSNSAGTNAPQETIPN